MNSVPAQLPVEQQEAAVAPPFKVTILYECVDTGKHAKRFSDQLMVAAELEQPPALDLWNFRVLALRETRNAAASAAAVADMVVFAMSGSRALPASVERWIEMWTWLMDSRKPAVVALFSAPHAERARIQTYLRGVAASKGLGFFPQTSGGSENPLRGNEIAASTRSDIDVLGATYRQLSRRVQ